MIAKSNKTATIRSEVLVIVSIDASGKLSKESVEAMPGDVFDENHRYCITLDFKKLAQIPFWQDRQ